ncbi:MAG: efflux RND transporter periplasmic adaptor subunit [Bacteroidales bacterium]|jgi:RND family efflux transporter MFP subunit|nr:efflux RND transporter periplasmic adaptor subunit [Bacteroidales bacterium]
MRKFLFISIIVLTAFACSTGDDAEAIRQEIKDHKDEISQLNIRIKELEQELSKMEETGDEYIIPVSIETMKYRTFHHYFQVSGTVEAVEQAYISPEINGQVKAVLVSEGNTVKKGQLLAKLNTSITENTIEEVKTQLELASTLYEKQKQLWEKNIGSEVQFLQAKNNKEALESSLQTLQAQLDMAYIKSPIDGIVDMINIEEGELAMPGLQIMQVVNLDKMKVTADVSENYLPVIHPGDIVHLAFPTYPSLAMDVPVHRTGNIINLGNRTFPVELRIDNVNAKLKPNILALITFLDYSKDQALIVPSIIVKKDMKGRYIYVARDVDGALVAKKVYITTGMSYNDETMVVSGLNPGDQVIIKGYNLVTDGTEVNFM